MIATLLLIPLDGSGIFQKKFNWSTLVECPTTDDPSRHVKISEISLFDDTPVVDGKSCHIASMYSE